MACRVDMPLAAATLFTERKVAGAPPRAPITGVANILGYAIVEDLTTAVGGAWPGWSPRDTVSAAEFVALVQILQFRNRPAGALMKEISLGGVNRVISLPSEPVSTASEADPRDGEKPKELPPWCTCEPEDVGMDRESLEKCRRYLNYRIGRKHFAGIVSGVVKNGKLVYFDEAGHADIAGKVPMKQDTLMRLFSMTKCLTVVAFLSYAEDPSNGIDLDDPVWKYIPSFKHIKLAPKRGSTKPRDLEMGSFKFGDGKTVRGPTAPTLRHLLTHTAGLGYGPTLGDSFPPKSTDHFKIYADIIERTHQKKVNSLAQWIDELAKVPLKVRPGSYWEYSFSTDVLGRVVEVISGMPLDKALDERVCRPLGMVDTHFVVPPEKLHRLGPWYERKNPVDDKGQEYEKVPPGATYSLREIDKGGSESGWSASNASTILSGGGTVEIPLDVKGGMVSTFRDYLRFLMMLRNVGELDGVRVLRRETVQTMICNQIPAATGRRAAWVFDKKGQGFSFVGQIQVQHNEKETFSEKGELKKGGNTLASLAPGTVSGEYGWGGLGGPAFTLDPRLDLIVLSMSQTALELDHEENLRFSARRAIHVGIFGPTVGGNKVTDYPPEAHECVRGFKLRPAMPAPSLDGSELNAFMEAEMEAQKRDKTLKELANARGNLGHEFPEDDDGDGDGIKCEPDTPKPAGPSPSSELETPHVSKKRCAGNDGTSPPEAKKRAIEGISPGTSEAATDSPASYSTPTKVGPEALLFSRVCVKAEDSDAFQKARVTMVDGDALEVIDEKTFKPLNVSVSDIMPIDESRAPCTHAARGGPTDFGFLMPGASGSTKSSNGSSVPKKTTFGRSLP
eukprot:TRINITY_DN8725_c0_g2_i1.p1 TRINITY_DN8725_c0_g2~~TRINITY_DN8725_c0_g2_i1.p1  ORF type:complete len:872 (-),score=183.41 TRINITY_DN8725_c0_g2_i1:243-2783(-)